MAELPYLYTAICQPKMWGKGNYAIQIFAEGFNDILAAQLQAVYESQKAACLYNDKVTTGLVGHCPGIARNFAKCPACEQIHDINIIAGVIHLNDYHQWTRERIADWLDTLDVDLTIR